MKTTPCSLTPSGWPGLSNVWKLWPSRRFVAQRGCTSLWAWDARPSGHPIKTTTRQRYLKLNTVFIDRVIGRPKSSSLQILVCVHTPQYLQPIIVNDTQITLFRNGKIEAFG